MTNLDPDRCARAADAIREGRVHIEPGPEPDTWVVSSFTGDDEYLVTTAPPSCTCPDARIRGRACKHRLAVLLSRGLKAVGAS